VIADRSRRRRPRWRAVQPGDGNPDQEHPHWQQGQGGLSQRRRPSRQCLGRRRLQRRRHLDRCPHLRQLAGQPLRRLIPPEAAIGNGSWGRISRPCPRRAPGYVAPVLSSHCHSRASFLRASVRRHRSSLERRIRRARNWQFMELPTAARRCGQRKCLPRFAAPWSETFPEQRRRLNRSPPTRSRGRPVQWLPTLVWPVSDSALFCTLVTLDS
jgi:hypothetical protein